MNLPSFTNPNALFLLLILPILARIGWPRLAYRRRRDLISLGIRLMLVTLIILGLAGLQIRQRADKLAVVFLVDVSDSMDAVAQKEALEYVRAAVETMSEDDQAAVVLFGANALVEEPMQALLDLSQTGVTPITLNTNLAEAVQLGLALFPPDTAKRLVILSDGIQTTGDGERAARLAAATGAQIDYVPFARQRFPEVLVSHVSVPSVVSQDEPFDIVVNVESETATQATLRVLSSGQVIYDEPVSLQPGDNRYAIGPIQWARVGFLDFRVQIEPASVDGFYRNNELAAFTQITGRPSILLVAQDEAETQYLQEALTDSGLVVETTTPGQIPTSLAGLSAYSSVVLANVPATELTTERMELLEIYVRDLGGGLVTVGGPDSYGVGGYFETPLERTLPVEMRIRDRERLPQLALIFVIDRSGSMEIVGTSGFSNLELAKEAVLRSFHILNDYDRVGVVSFDHQAFWVVDLQEIGDPNNRAVLENRIASLQPGGGTDIFGGLTAASQVLPDDPSELKHIILLTDGGANPSGVLPLVDRMFTNHDITTTAIAVGQNYERWMENIPQRGGGNFYVTSNVENIPTIFAAETVLATRSYIFEEPFNPAQTAPSPILEGITSAPQLHGYVATTGKDTATVILTGPEDDPLLASWQYGLGRSVAFTSDATARWGQDWINWEQYARFWNQAVRWTITEGRDSNLEAYVEERGDQAVLVVDARDNRGNYLNALELDAAVVHPDRSTESITMTQVAPGRYEAAFIPSREGAYFLRVAGATRPEAAIEASVAETTGWVLSYSAEYRPRETDTRFLGRIAALTNGGSLAGDPNLAFAHNLDHEEAALPLWPYLLALAAFLLVLDIAVRRIVINRSDIERARVRLTGAFQREPAYQETETSAVLSGLKAAKRRASRSTAEEEIPSDSDRPPIPRQRPAPEAEAPDPAPTSTEQPPAETTEEGTLAARLLERRRQSSDD